MSDFMDDFVVMCDGCYEMMQTEFDHKVSPLHHEMMDWCADMVRTPRRPFGEYVRTCPDGFTACVVCDGEGLELVHEVDDEGFTDEEWEAMFGLCDPLDHYGK